MGAKPKTYFRTGEGKTSTPEDRRVAHIRRIVGREFGVLARIIDNGGVITQHYLSRSEAYIRRAFTSGTSGD